MYHISSLGEIVEEVQDRKWWKWWQGPMEIWRFQMLLSWLDKPKCGKRGSVAHKQWAERVVTQPTCQHGGWGTGGHNACFLFRFLSSTHCVKSLDIGKWWHPPPCICFPPQFSSQVAHMACFLIQSNKVMLSAKFKACPYLIISTGFPFEPPMLPSEAEYWMTVTMLSLCHGCLFLDDPDGICSFKSTWVSVGSSKCATRNSTVPLCMKYGHFHALFDLCLQEHVRGISQYSLYKTAWQCAKPNQGPTVDIELCIPPYRHTPPLPPQGAPGFEPKWRNCLLLCLSTITMTTI